MTRLADLMHRRRFLKASTLAATAGLTAGTALAAQTSADTKTSLTILGPRPGYSPQIGTLVSMMDFCRAAVLRRAKGMTQADLDFLLDAKANTIGALLMHLAATDALYRVNTLEGKTWGAYDDKLKQDWNVAMDLGDPARKTIKGKSLDYYLNLLTETREATLAELKKRDDQWFMAVEKDFPWGPTNHYCMWFHVCEHESHHDGQIAMIKGRLPGAKQESKG